MNKLAGDASRAALLLLSVSSCVEALGAATTIQLPPETAKLKSSSLAGYTVAAQKCGICHSADYISFQPPAMTKAQWTAEMQKMQHVYGAPIDDNEIKLLGIYLAATYGDASGVSAEDRALTLTAGTSSAEGLLNSNGCLGCHSIKDKVVGPAYRDVAAKYESDADALSKVEASIHGGGSGKWGQVPMPPFGTLSAEQLKTLAEFVLAQ
jgi:cytochrome c551/c552